MAENIYLTPLLKSLTLLFFEHISEENRKICITLGQAELVSDICTMVIVAWLACVCFDILAL